MDTSGKVIVNQTHFTLVFAGDLRKYRKNSHHTDTPFGRPIVVGLGNAFDEFDVFCSQREALVHALNKKVATFELVPPGSARKLAAWIAPSRRWGLFLFLCPWSLSLGLEVWRHGLVVNVGPFSLGYSRIRMVRA